jgi:hypothetical protein
VYQFGSEVTIPNKNSRQRKSAGFRFPGPGLRYWPEWRLVMKRIRAASDSSGSIAAFGWWCLGVGVSSLLSAVAYFVSADFGDIEINWLAVAAEFMFCLLAGLGFICGALSLKYAKQHRHDKAQILEYVLEDIQEFSDKHTGSGAAP